VNGFPTVFFLASQGNEIDRICGFDGSKDNYFKTLDKALKKIILN
jgi:hypothetical protein